MCLRVRVHFIYSGASLHIFCSYIDRYVSRISRGHTDRCCGDCLHFLSQHGFSRPFSSSTVSTKLACTHDTCTHCGSSHSPPLHIELNVGNMKKRYFILRNIDTHARWMLFWTFDTIWDDMMEIPFPRRP